MRELIDSMGQKDDFIRVFCMDGVKELERCSTYELKDPIGGVQTIKFHEGPVSAGINGVTNEAVLRVVFDRLRPTPGRWSPKLDEARKRLRSALSLLREDFNEPWPDMEA